MNKKKVRYFLPISPYIEENEFLLISKRGEVVGGLTTDNPLEDFKKDYPQFIIKSYETLPKSYNYYMGKVDNFYEEEA